jgi:hypothetical protein
LKVQRLRRKGYRRDHGDAPLLPRGERNPTAQAAAIDLLSSRTTCWAAFPAARYDEGMGFLVLLPILVPLAFALYCRRRRRFTLQTLLFVTTCEAIALWLSMLAIQCATAGFP